MIKLAPSILAADFTRLGENVEQADRAGADYIHLDVMDGVFVPSISFGMPVIRSLRKATDKIFDVHLMVSEPARYIGDFADCGADILTVHAEACRDVAMTIRLIHERGIRAGLALNPATPLCCLEHILDDLDMILIMTVSPGFGGQKYIESSTGKIAALRRMLKERGRETEIEVDGGINKDTVGTVLEAGADVLVMGTSVFSGDIAENTAYYRKVFREFEAGRS